MDTNQILADLRAERDRLDKAIAALEALEGASAPAPMARRGRPPKSASAPSVAQPKPTRGGRRTISAEGRKRIAEAAKRMWAKRRKKTGTSKSSAPVKAEKKTAPFRQMSEAARKRISAAAKRRWAAQKKAAVPKA